VHSLYLKSQFRSLLSAAVTHTFVLLLCARRCCVQLQHLQAAGLLQPRDVQFAVDLWGQPGYGLGESRYYHPTIVRPAVGSHCPTHHHDDMAWHASQ
jgi:hypothetical protein